MIVCSCHAVSDGALREAARAGLSPREVMLATGAGTDCGGCRESVAEIVAGLHAPCREDSCPGCPGLRQRAA